MEVTRTMEVYTLDELSEEARAKAVSRMRERALVPTDWVTESVNGCFVELATGEESDGYEEETWDSFGVRIVWSVGYTQSDGAHLRGKLRRETTPMLPWCDGVAGVDLDYDGRIDRIVLIDEDADTYSDATYDALREMLRGIGRKLYEVARATCEDYESEGMAVMRYEEGLDGERRRFLADGSEAPEAFWSDDNDKESEVG